MKIKFRQEYFAVALSVKSLWPDQRKGRSLSVSLSIEKNSVVCLAHHDKTKENRIIELVPKSTGDRSWVCSRIFQNHINSLTFCLDSARQPAIARWPILERSREICNGTDEDQRSMGIKSIIRKEKYRK
jgi:hypothetical protein